MKIHNKNILITGGSAGLGLELAIQLSQSQNRVAIIARNQENLKKVQQAYPNIEIIHADISKQNDIHRIHAEVLSKIGDIEILINNASSLGHTPLRLLIDTDCEVFSDVLETNLLGPFRLSKLVLPPMILKGQGQVVNISSDAAIQDYPNWGPYSISKSALDHLTRIFAAELRHTGVQFLAVDPGDMHTSLHLTAIPDADTKKLYKPQDSARLLIKLLENNQLSPEHRGLR